jgi:hypothetical protein
VKTRCGSSRSPARAGVPKARRMSFRTRLPRRAYPQSADDAVTAGINPLR